MQEAAIIPPRERTRATLLALIREQVGVTRAELIEATGLPRSTVSHAVGKLIESGVVVETEAAEKGPGSGSGRPGLVLRAVGSGRYVAGIDFGHTHISVAIADEQGEEIASDRMEIDVDLNAVQAMDAAAGLLDRLRGAHPESDVAYVVAGVPIPIDYPSGRVSAPATVSPWGGLLPAAELERRLGIPVHVENDSVIGAYGELKRGAGRELRDFIYIKASHGIGASLILNGMPYRGASGLAGDIGHNKVPGRSELCRCGDRGCLEAAVSLDAIRAQIAHTHPAMEPRTSTFDDVDDVTVRILAEAGRVIGAMVAQQCNLLNPEAVIVGGTLAYAHPALMEGVAWSVRELARPTISAQAQILVAGLGERSGLVGALQMASHRAGLHLERIAG